MGVLIERKEFSVEWRGAPGRSAIVLYEKSKKRFARGFVSKECASWLGATVRNCGGDWEKSLQEEGEPKRWVDDTATAELVVLRNDSGAFIKLEVTPVSIKGAKVLFFIPAGKRGGGVVVLF